MLWQGRTRARLFVQIAAIVSGARVLRFTNCALILGGVVTVDDLFVCEGVTAAAASLFWRASATSTVASEVVIDCGGHVLAPGFIDIQINGGFGVDFSDAGITHRDIAHVCTSLLRHGVTAICPTLVSSAPATYAATIPKILDTMHAQSGDRLGSRMLGLHLEGPFIAAERKGAHAESHLRAPVRGMASLLETYGQLDLPSSTRAPDAAQQTTASQNSVGTSSTRGAGTNPADDGMASTARVGEAWTSGDIRIVTLAPELEGGLETVDQLTRMGIAASIGHTSSDIRTADAAVAHGACLITHLFNAMSAFHHRDPGVVGLLGRMFPGGAATLAGKARHVPSSSAWIAAESAGVKLDALASPPAGRAAVEQAALGGVTPITGTTTSNRSHAISDGLHDGDGGSMLSSAEGREYSPRAPRRHGDSDLSQVTAFYAASSRPPALRLASGSAETPPHVAPAHRFSIHSIAPPIGAPRTPEIPGPRAVADAKRPFVFTTRSSLARMAGTSATQPDTIVASDARTVRAKEAHDEVLRTPAMPSSIGRVTPWTKAPLFPRFRMPDGSYDIGRPFYSLIADGVHCHPYAITMAYNTHPDGLILVTDAMKAMGLPVGRHTLGELEVDIFHGLEDGHYEGLHAVLAGTSTLAGAVVPLDQCVRNLQAFTRCPLTQAIASVTLHPARALRVHSFLGDLRPGCWADMVLLDVGVKIDCNKSGAVDAAVLEGAGGIKVLATFLAGQLAWSSADDKWAQ